MAADDPNLATLWLDPDGKYQTRALRLDSLAKEVAERLSRSLRQCPREAFPTLYCAWSKARVGSTALINLFGIAGMPAYFQPVKAVLRHRLTEGEPDPWQLPAAAAQPQIVSKDVAGPYLLAECLYIPLQLLIEAGYPSEKLHLIVLDRDPVKSLASWIDKWSDRVVEPTLLRNYVLASLNATRVKAYARRHGVPITHYVYEASRDAVGSARALFGRLGLAQRFTETVVTDWAEKGHLESPSSPIIHPREPAVYFVPGLHASHAAYRYRERAAAGVGEAHRALLARHGVEDLYRAHVAASIAELGLDPRLFAEATAERPADAVGARERRSLPLAGHAGAA